MPNILCVANYFVNHGGGVEQMAHGLATGLNAEAGWTVALAAHAEGRLPPPSETCYETIVLRCSNALEIHFGLPLILPHPVDLLRLVRRSETANLVLLHDCVYLTHLALLLAALLRRQKVIVIKHTGRVRLRNRAANWLQSFAQCCANPLLRRADRVIFVTEQKKQNYRGLDDRSIVIANGIDTDHFVPAAAPAASVTDILFVGRFVEKKGVEILREMARQAPDLRFCCAGFGPVDPLCWQLANVMVEERPNLQRLSELYAGAGLLVLPAETEGSPLVLFEALSSGTPVLASLTARPDDASTCSVATFQAIDLDDPAKTAAEWLIEARRLLLAPRRSEERRAPILSNHSLNIVAARYRTLIIDVLGQHPHLKRAVRGSEAGVP